MTIVLYVCGSRVAAKKVATSKKKTLSSFGVSPWPVAAQQQYKHSLFQNKSQIFWRFTCFTSNNTKTNNTKKNACMLLLFERMIRDVLFK